MQVDSIYTLAMIQPQSMYWIIAIVQEIPSITWGHFWELFCKAILVKETESEYFEGTFDQKEKWGSKMDKFVPVGD